MSLLPLGNLLGSSSQTHWNEIAFSPLQDQPTYSGPSKLGNRLVRHENGSLETIPKTPAEIVGERLIRPLIDTAFDLSTRSFSIIKSGLSFVNNFLSKACAFLPTAEASPVPSKQEQSNSNLKCSAPLSVPAASSEIIKLSAAMDGNGNIVALGEAVESLVSTNLPFEGNWTIPASLNGKYGHIEMNSKGQAVATWQLTVPSTAINASTFIFGQSWSNPVTLIGDAGIGDHDVGIDENGNAVTVWALAGGFLSEVQTSSLPFGGTWSSPKDLGELSIYARHDDPKVAVDPLGNAVAAWSFNPADVLTTTCPFGKSWTNPTWLNGTIPQSGISYGGIKLAVGGNGDAILVFYDDTYPTSYVIQAAILPFGGQWSPYSVLSTWPSNDEILGPFDLAIDAQGNSVVVWSETLNVKASVRPYNGQWTVPATLSQVPAKAVSVGVDANGNAVVGWTSIISTVQLSIGSLSQGSWTSPIDIGTSQSYALKVKVNAKGDVAALWGSNGNLQAVRCSGLVSHQENNKP